MASMAKIEVERGPALRAAFDVLDLANELADALPPWEPKREELLKRAKGLAELCQELLKERYKLPAD